MHTPKRRCPKKKRFSNFDGYERSRKDGASGLSDAPFWNAPAAKAGLQLSGELVIVQGACVFGLRWDIYLPLVDILGHGGRLSGSD